MNFLKFLTTIFCILLIKNFKKHTIFGVLMLIFTLSDIPRSAFFVDLHNLNVKKCHCAADKKVTTL